MQAFTAVLDIIGINPFVFVPSRILNKIFLQAGKDKGPVPVCGTVNKNPFSQTLVKYKGDWRLYINTSMVKDSPKRIGETLKITIAFDPVERTQAPHPEFSNALKKNLPAKKVFEKLSPSRQKEIIRYLSSLKSEESVVKNIERAIGFLSGKNRFIGRDKP